MASDYLMSAVAYNDNQVYLKDLVQAFQKNRNELLYGMDNRSGYPVGEILQAIAYLIVPQAELNGKRPKGKFMSIIKSQLMNYPDFSVKCVMPNRLTPLGLFHNNRGALIGPKNPNVYAKLIIRDTENPYKLMVRSLNISDLDEK